MRGLLTHRAGQDPSTARFMLPLSGRGIALRRLSGREDVLLAEGHVEDPALALALIERVARCPEQVDLGTLPVADADVLIVRLRQAMLGDQVCPETVCTAAGCGKKIDIPFRLSAYLAHHRAKSVPLRMRGLVVDRAADQAGWYHLAGPGTPELHFRLPSLSDLVAVWNAPDRTRALAERCLRPTPPAPLRRLAERAMEALAPPLAGTLQGACPECGAQLNVVFEARLYCLQELSDRARFVYEDIDLLASRYHWSERAILDLPSERRNFYAERARQMRLAS
jgi:hypothetical protein